MAFLSDKLQTEKIDIESSSNIQSFTVDDRQYLIKSSSNQYRILNEYIATQISKFILDRLKKTFIQEKKTLTLFIPNSELVYQFTEAGVSLVGIASRRLDYDGLDESERYTQLMGDADFLKELINRRLGVGVGLRQIVRDPDGRGNFGFYPKDTKNNLMLIDFGLSDFHELERKSLLTEDENGRADPKSTGDLLFRVLPEPDSEYLDHTLHIFYDSVWNDINRQDLKDLFSDYYLTLDKFCEILLSEAFVEELIAFCGEQEKGPTSFASLLTSSSEINSIFQTLMQRYRVFARETKASLDETDEISFLEKAKASSFMSKYCVADLEEMANSLYTVLQERKPCTPRLSRPSSPLVCAFIDKCQAGNNRFFSPERKAATVESTENELQNGTVLVESP